MTKRLLIAIDALVLLYCGYFLIFDSRINNPEDQLIPFLFFGWPLVRWIIFNKPIFFTFKKEETDNG